MKSKTSEFNTLTVNNIYNIHHNKKNYTLVSDYYFFYKNNHFYKTKYILIYNIY